MRRKLIKEAKADLQLAVTKCLTGAKLTPTELAEVSTASQSDLMRDYDCDLFMADTIKMHVKNELYRLRAQNQFTKIDGLPNDTGYPSKPLTRTDYVKESRSKLKEDVDMMTQAHKDKKMKTSKSKVSRKSLSECSDEEMVNIMAMDVLGVGALDATANLVTKAVSDVSGKKTDNRILKARMSQYIGMLRGMQLWYHAAHHVTRGTGFFGDHADLYGMLYTEVGDDVDSAIEKAIGLTNDEDMANPCKITDLAVLILKKYPCPPTLTALALASTALEIEKNHNELVTVIFHELESAGCLSLGLDDMLMATINEHEGHIYKLQQRVKTELEN